MNSYRSQQTVVFTEGDITKLVVRQLKSGASSIDIFQKKSTTGGRTHIGTEVAKKLAPFLKANSSIFVTRDVAAKTTKKTAAKKKTPIKQAFRSKGKAKATRVTSFKE